MVSDIADKGSTSKHETLPPEKAALPSFPFPSGLSRVKTSIRNLTLRRVP